MGEWEIEHIARLDEGEWVKMYDDAGVTLKGIEGKAGVRYPRGDGTFMGADFIRMQPGSRFPMHLHQGDHEIFFIQGHGYVTIDEKIIFVGPGDLIHIPGEYPHSVGLPHRAPMALIFVAVGHPHHKIGSTKRMVVVREKTAGAK